MLREKSIPYLGFTFFDQVLFSTFFWERDLSLPMSTKQKVMYNDMSEKRLNCTGRKTAKTILLEGAVTRISCVHEGSMDSMDEGMFFTPGDVHMTRVRDRIMSKFETHDVFRHFKIKYNKNDGVLDIATGLRWYFRIEGSSGRETNMVGPTCIYMLGDELAFGNQACEMGRKQTALPGCRWMYCGVPNGVRNSPFYELDQTHLGDEWSRHKLTSLDNPMYSDKYGSAEAALKKLEREYGDRNSQGFVTQVLGEWGEEAYSAFPLSMIASRQLPFMFMEFTGNEIEHAIQENSLDRLIRLPRTGADRYAIGLDYGYSQDPAILILAYETYNNQLERYEWLELARMKFIQVPAIHQAKVINFINQSLDRRVKAIVSDRYDVITSLTNKDSSDSLGNQDNYSEKTYCSAPQGTMELIDHTGAPVIDDKTGKPVMMRTKQWMTEQLRNSMSYANSNILHPYYLILSSDDIHTIEELVNTVERKTAGGYVRYEPARRGEDHNTDALRDLIYAIHQIVISGEAGEYEEDLAGLGFVPASAGQQATWKAPWLH